MNNPESESLNHSEQESRSAENTIAISPELVKEIADQVYALLLRDLKIEKERAGFRETFPFTKPGGRQ